MAAAGGIAEGGVAEQSRRILVTGGAGYIGSHTVLELVNAGWAITVVDNLANSSQESLKRVGELTGKPEQIVFEKCDLLDAAALDRVFAATKFDAVVHFAGLKAVGDSISHPIEYYHNNLTGTFHLLQSMRRHGCKRIIFSSSATVYGSAPPPLSEDSPAGAGITNPYGQSKFMLERVLTDAAHADEELSVVLLRYFNPVGAHESGRIGEDPAGRPNNLMPFVLQVAIGRREKLTVFGGDYATRDGTAERDYIHVVDLARGHLKALEWQLANGPGTEVFNLGTGGGVSVLEVIAAMSAAAGRPVPYEVGPRRSGDLAVVTAIADKAERVLGWKATKSLADMCADGWRWQQANPWGYRPEEEAARLG